MDNQTLSQLLDRVIAEVLAQSVAQKNVCVVVTGEDISSLPETLNCLEALELAGYQLWVNFSPQRQPVGAEICLHGCANSAWFSCWI